MLTEPDPTTALGRLSLRARRVPAPIRGVLVGGALLVSLVCLVAELPPYSTFADAQASAMDGTHYPILTFMLTFIVFALPAGVVVHLLAGRYPELPQPPNPFGPGPFANQPFPQGPSPYDPQSPYWQGSPGAGHGRPAPGQASYGQAPTPYGQAPAPYGQAPAPYGQAPAPYGQAPAPHGQAPTPYGQAPAPHGQAPAPHGPPRT